jgi:tyrosinase
MRHSNIDRIIAIYQHRYPDTYVEASKQAKASFTVAKDSIQDGNSPLSPFRMNADPGTVWTSNLVRDWEHFGYTYPELEGKPSNDSLTITINRMYQKKSQGLQNSTTQSLRFRTRNGETKKADAWQWMAEVNLPSDIQTTYSVRAFLGAPNADPKKWATDPNYVGQVASLASPRLDMDSDIIVTANIALTNRLQDKFEAGELKSLERRDVQAYLKENFYWRIQKADSTEILRNQPPAGLNCTVFSVPVHLPESEIDVPVFAGDFEYDQEIDGRPVVAQITQPKPLPTGYRRVFKA